MIEYHPGKADVVAKALSRKSMAELKAMFTRFSLASDDGLLAEHQVRLTLLQQIKEKQSLDEDLLKRISQVEQGVKGDFDIDSDGILNFLGRLCVPHDGVFRHAILTKAHSSLYAMHPIRGLLQSIVIPEWKWERITMDFVLCLALTPAKKDLVWKLAELYITEIVHLYGVPVSIIFFRDLHFTSRSCKSLQEALRLTLWFCKDYHPQIDGQSKRSAYNNGFQASICMALFEALYERKCRTLLCWTELDEKQKSYSDLKHQDIEFQVSDKVFLKVSL
ncbi:uncharacterized protein LOC128033897 [Gossypium raimondii]|uniref:uncharacterized protein LOC128033897 n=1 Tax=Gossypium raimondii TaxID=29730 RepID=UPI00227C7AC2|nr:uncharacterized protein LOC128033897 [Gossypium raimondii]